MTVVRAAELWRRVALVSGIDATYGAPFGALEVVPVAGAVAPLFAAAHQRVHGVRAATHRGDGVFWLPGLGAGACRTVVADSPDALVAAVPALSSNEEVELRITLDPDQPVEGSVPSSAAHDDNWIEPLDETVTATDTAVAVVVLAGPGVIRDGAVPGLHDLAVSAGVGVLNTWGAKGVFDWRSRHHLATVGLQADDFMLSELDRRRPDHRDGLGPS